MQGEHFSLLRESITKRSKSLRKTSSCYWRFHLTISNWCCCAITLSNIILTAKWCPNYIRNKSILHLLTYYLWCTYYIFAKGCSRAQSFTSSSLRADLRQGINRVHHCSLEEIAHLTEWITTKNEMVKKYKSLILSSVKSLMQPFLRVNLPLELLLTVLTEICLQRSKWLDP